jgi:hypothetical protein
MHAFTKVGMLVGFAFAIATSLSLAQAQTNCTAGCLQRVQYNSPYMTPEQQYQERQREWQQRQDADRDRRRQTEMELDTWRRRNGYDTPSGPSSYGAIAYSPDSGDYGHSYNYSSRSAAESRARKECGKSDCQIAAWFSNSCGALSIDDDTGAWGGGNGGSEQVARADAQKSCAGEGGKNCKVEFSVCSR